MRKLLTRAILVTGTLAAALSLGVPAAMAVTTWTVTGGTNWTSKQAANTTFTLTDTQVSGGTIACTAATGAGTVTDETQGTNTWIGTITSFSLSICTGPLGSSVSCKSKGTWTIHVISYNSVTGVTTGTITGVDLICTINEPGGGTCTIEVTGTVGFTYNNNTDLLSFTLTNDSLKIVSSTCPEFHVGDSITFSSGSGGEIIIGSPVNPIQISSP